MIDLPPLDGLHLKALDYRTAATQHADGCWRELESFVRTYGEACARAALEATPMQPLVLVDGVIRFKENAIVRALLNRDTERGRTTPEFPARSGGGMNWIDTQDFSPEDRQQFAQLIGYSLSGYGELEYVSDEAYDDADERATALKRALKDKP